MLDYSIHPATAGTIKPKKDPYRNHPPIAELARQKQKQGLPHGIPDYFQKIYPWLPHILANEPDFYMRNDPAPIPDTADRESYHGDDHIAWWWSGLVNWLTIRDLYERYRAPLKAGNAFFELGCASGRVLRHAMFQNPDIQVIGCDLNARHVDWLQSFLPKRALVFQNYAYPNLPLGDNSLDLAAAFSVFTHIDDLESAWLMELRRILKPGAILVISIMSNLYWRKLATEQDFHWAASTYLKYNSEYSLTRESFEKPMPQKRLALSYGGSCYNCVVFHHLDYIRAVWGRYFDILDILERGTGMQDIIVLRKPA